MTLAGSNFANPWSEVQDFNGAYKRFRRTTATTVPSDLLVGEIVISTSTVGDIWAGIL